MAIRHVLLIMGGYLCTIIPLSAQDISAFESKQLVHRGDTLPYQILYPEGYDAKEKYPVLFFLHGAGERGNDNEKQLVHGASLFLTDSVRLNFPAIVVFPQCPSNSFWSNVNFQQVNGQREFHFSTGGNPTVAMRLLLKLIDGVVKREAVDKQRIYVGGLSMGGMGTYEALRRKPKLFAAAFAICGGDNTANVAKYSHVPLWIFHGEQDDVVPVTHSKVIVEELKRLGVNPKHTFYPEANHNSWDPAFAEPDFLPWLFSQQKK